MPGCHLRKYGWGKWADWRKKSQQHFCTDCIHFIWPDTHHLSCGIFFSTSLQVNDLFRSHSRVITHALLCTLKTVYLLTYLSNWGL
jgi:hypothetical protein